MELLVERVLPSARGRGAGARQQDAAAGHACCAWPRRFDAEVLGRGGPDEQVAVPPALPGDEPLALLRAHGHVPLPPYITHADDADDERALPDRVRRASRARWRRRPRRCTSTTALLGALRARGVATRQRHAARRRRHLPAGAAARTSPSTACTASGTRCRRRPSAAIAATRAARRPHRRRGHHHRALARVRPHGGHACGRPRRDRHLHHAGLRVPRGRPAGHQLPPAAQHAADAGQRLCRPRAGHGAVPACDRRSATASSATATRCCSRAPAAETIAPC